jgi:hypothetical protein
MAAVDRAVRQAMHTTLLADVEPLPNDGELLSDLEREADSPLGGQPLLSFGLEGPDGRVYRVVTTNSLWQTARLFDTLTAKGLVVDKGRSEAGVQLSRVFRPR